MNVDQRAQLRVEPGVSRGDRLIAIWKRGGNRDIELEFSGRDQPRGLEVAGTPPILITGNGDSVPDWLTDPL